MMLERLLKLMPQAPLSPPSLWGKVPAHGDFVTHNATADDCLAWQQWFECHPLHQIVSNANVELNTPSLRQRSAGWLHLEVEPREKKLDVGVWGFALPPGSLPNTRHIPDGAVLIGAMAESCDKVGRIHPLVIWSTLRPEALAQLNQPLHWPYWLARLLAQHVPPISRPGMSRTGSGIQQQLQDLWKEAHGAIAPRFSIFRRNLPSDMLDSLIDHYHVEPNFPVKRHIESDFGLRNLPWSDWPNRLTASTMDMGYFWQQGQGGKYLNCATLDLNPEVTA